MPKHLYHIHGRIRKIREWARELADKLLENGIDAYIDQYDLSLGDRLPQFMEQRNIRFRLCSNYMYTRV
ncbi:toll/interleukin-1 receptor domain-containing protein (plasmid) [Enterococcus faecium]|uniref:toll/interleukin-1 receptor domain-containing protein n=1 Tax=Enterococcus faecium TaxID=1352 RepID=UPI003F84FF37